MGFPCFITSSRVFLKTLKAVSFADCSMQDVLVKVYRGYGELTERSRGEKAVKYVIERVSDTS